MSDELSQQIPRSERFRLWLTENWKLHTGIALFMMAFTWYLVIIKQDHGFAIISATLVSAYFWWSSLYCPWGGSDVR